MVIYIDADHRVHIKSDTGLTAVETDVFNSMDPAVMECYCYYPPDGIKAEFVQAWAPPTEIARRQLMAKTEALNTQNDELVNTIASMVEEVYESDLEVME